MMSTGTSLWMGDLEHYMDEAFINNAFLQMGHIVMDVKLIRDRTSGAPAGYCFVDLPDSAAAQLALHQVNGKNIPGSHPNRRFKLNHATYNRNHEQTPEYSLYVGDLSPDVDDLTLYQAFAKRYPSCRAAKVVTDMEHRSKGFGFIRFTDDTERKQALIEMQRHSGLGKWEIRLSLAAPRRAVNNAANSVPLTSQPYYNQYGSQNYWNYDNSYYNSGYNSYQPYWGYNYQGYYDQTNAQVQQYYQATTEPESGDDEALEDPCIEEDVDKLNRELIEKSEELYMALEGSRWHPLDNVLSPITPSQVSPST